MSYVTFQAIMTSQESKNCFEGEREGVGGGGTF